MKGAPGKLAYTPLEYIEIGHPVDRISYITEACKNKAVLDLGALDETAFTKKSGSGVWLHEEIARVAARVVGVDQSEIVPDNGMVTGANSFIVRGDVFNLGEIVEKYGMVPDVIVAGELIEHLENPLSFFRSLRNVRKLTGTTVVLSTPNATAIHNVTIGLANRESMHHDHLCVFSFKTLSTLLGRAGYQEWLITPYHSEFAEMKERNTGARRQVVVAGERLIKLLERVFPILSFGWIVERSI